MNDEELREDTPHNDSGLSDEDFSKLLNSISTMAPLMKNFLGNMPFGGKKSPCCERREAFLLALKPYLSPTRCDAVDYLIRIGRIGDSIRALQ